VSIWAFRRRGQLLRIPARTWQELIAELAARGQGTRESGAFLLADKTGDPRTVTRVVYFDDVDPDCLVGAIHIQAPAFGRLWKICREEQRRVVSDIHTHPSTWVHQSGSDVENPVIAMAGHVAIIAPNYGQGAITPRDVGVHLFNGTGWQTWTGKPAARRVRVMGNA
jgi:proteasome lid subunit RPN8/RPN11